MYAIHREERLIKSGIVDACIKLIENDQLTVIEEYKTWYKTEGIKLGYIKKSEEITQMVKLASRLAGSEEKLSQATNIPRSKFQASLHHKLIDAAVFYKILNFILINTNTVKIYVEKLNKNSDNEYVITERVRNEGKKGRKLSSLFLECQKGKNKKLMRLVKSLFGNYWGYMTVSMRDYPSIFNKVDRRLRKYLSYALITGVGIENLKLVEKMIQRGGIGDKDLTYKERKALYKMKDALKIRGLDDREPSLYVDVNFLKDYALRTRGIILERIKSQIASYPKNFYQCGSCGKLYNIDELSQTNYRCQCNSNNIIFMEEHPESSWLHYVLQKVNTEFPF